MKLAIPDMISNSYFPAIAAIELGMFKAEGLDVALEMIYPVDKCYAAMRDGAVEFVGGSAHSALAAFPEFHGVKLLGAQARARYGDLAADVSATVSLSAPAAAPVGIGSTGEPACTVHTSYLGIPSISLPLFRDEGLPLGLQVAGFPERDAETFATSAWIESALK